MFWTCDEPCTANRQEYEQRRKVYLDLNEVYLKGVAEVSTCSVVRSRTYDGWQVVW